MKVCNYLVDNDTILSVANYVTNLSNPSWLTIYATCRFRNVLSTVLCSAEMEPKSLETGFLEVCMHVRLCCKSSVEVLEGMDTIKLRTAASRIILIRKCGTESDNLKPPSQQ